MKINLEHLHSGKVRDTYALPDSELLLLVATDRISTHNVVHQSIIPSKGYVLTALTVFWMTELFPKFCLENNHHLVSYGQGVFDHFPRQECDDPDDLARRAVVVKKLDMIPIEFIFRSYLTGSLYKKFYSKGKENPYGVMLPSGMAKMSKFVKPIFTPTDKSETDDPLNSIQTYREHTHAHNVALTAYIGVRRHLNSVGIELIDSKLELGKDGIIGDEVFTPDSSRFCELLDIKEGQDPPWLDKQIARDEVERMFPDGNYSAVTFSSDTVEKLTETYLSIFKRITGRDLDQFQQV